MLFACILFGIVIIAITGSEWFRRMRPKGFPPGPIGLPFLGNLLPFRKSPLRAMMRWKEEYGDIVGLKLGQFRVVMISDYGLLKEAFNDEKFNGRPEFKPVLLFTGGETQGTLTSDGNPWAVIRRFTIKNLSNLGFGKKSAETMIQDDVAGMVSNLAKELEESKVIRLHEKFYVPVVNHLWYILVGQRIPDHQHETFKNALLGLHRTLWKPIGKSIWFMPTVTNLFPNRTGWDSLVETMPVVKSLVTQEIDKHKESLLSSPTVDAMEEMIPKDLIDAYLLTIARTKDKTSEFYEGHGENHMQSMVLNLFVTASEALSNTLNWVFIYLTLYPAVQQKLFEEIEEIVGVNRTPSLSDSPNMPYATAIIQEVFRLASTSPFSNFQMTTEDVKFHGYLIPKNTIVIANLFSIHHSESWGDPEVFRPERFLTQRSNQKLTPPVIPFSVGLRTCPAQALARNEVFLFMLTLCQRFSFEWNPTVTRPSAEDLIDQSHVSIFRFAKDYGFVLKDRLEI